MLSRFSKPYRSRLLAGFRDVQDFAATSFGCSLRYVLSDPNRADEILSQYVLERHHSSMDSKLSVVKHALLCCQHVQPKLKGRINTSWENLKVWEERRVTKLRPPLPVPLWLFMVGLSRAHAKVECTQALRKRWNMFAVLLEVGLLCMLRPGELLKLHHCDVSLPGDFTLSQPFAAIRIASPKNRRQFGAEQFVVLRNPNTISWLKEFVVEGSSAMLWEWHDSQFAKLFKQTCAELKISRLHPGGATMLYGQGTPISTLRFMGRWTVERSLEHYIQLAMSTQIMNKLLPEAVSRLKKVGHLCLEHVLLPHGCHPLQPLTSQSRFSAGTLVEWCKQYAALERKAW